MTLSGISVWSAHNPSDAAAHQSLNKLLGMQTGGKAFPRSPLLCHCCPHEINQAPNPSFNPFLSQGPIGRSTKRTWTTSGSFWRPNTRRSEKTGWLGNRLLPKPTPSRLVSYLGGVLFSVALVIVCIRRWTGLHKKAEGSELTNIIVLGWQFLGLM